LLAFAEAGHGGRDHSIGRGTDRYELQVVRIMHQRKTLLEPLAVVGSAAAASALYADKLTRRYARLRHIRGCIGGTKDFA
jgi:hypothetical protein